MRPASFKLQPIKSIHLWKEAVCFVEILDKNYARLMACGIKTPMENGEFVMVKKNNKIVAHSCHSNVTDAPPAPCHDNMWKLVYTNLQLEGEALLMIMLDVKNKVCKYFIRNVYILLK